MASRTNALGEMVGLGRLRRCGYTPRRHIGRPRLSMDDATQIGRAAQTAREVTAGLDGRVSVGRQDVMGLWRSMGGIGRQRYTLPTYRQAPQ